MENSETVVRFRNVDINCIYAENQIWVAIKPISEAIGLHAQSALNSIKNDPILKDGYAVQHTHDALGRLQKTFCMPIEHVHGWLFGIDIKKVKPAARENLIIFKKECYRVLFNRFYGQYQQIKTDMIEKLTINREISELYKAKYQSEKRIKELKQRLDHIDEGIASRGQMI